MYSRSRKHLVLSLSDAIDRAESARESRLELVEAYKPKLDFQVQKGDNSPIIKELGVRLSCWLCETGPQCFCCRIGVITLV
jgi:hypothetical protein